MPDHMQEGMPFKGVARARPSWLFALFPQDQTTPSFFTARLWLKPAATDATSVSALTCTGTYLLTVVPSPSAPSLL